VWAYENITIFRWVGLVRHINELTAVSHISLLSISLEVINGGVGG